MIRSQLLAVSRKVLAPQYRHYNLFTTMQNHQTTHTLFKQSPNLQCIVALAELDSKDLALPRPALGGARFVEYTSFEDATKDAVRLAEGMLNKSILAGLELSGGKSVILKPKNLSNEQRAVIFKEYGRLVQFINKGNTRYITAIDSGTTVGDMDIIRQETPYVASDSKFGDPTPYTAQGLFKGIMATVKHVYGEQDLSKLTLAMQGAGGTAYYLAKLLHKAGLKKLVVCDINKNQTSKFAHEFKAQIVKPEEIFSSAVDILSPCALGEVITKESLIKLNDQIKIIAGSANNQLTSPEIAQCLTDKGITYAPDYVINAGGLIYCVQNYYKKPAHTIEDKINQIPNTLLEIYKGAKEKNIPTANYANSLANSRISDLLEHQINKGMDKRKINLS